MSASNEAGTGTQTSAAHAVSSVSPGFGAKTLVTVKLSARRIAAGAPLPVRIANGNDFTVSGTLAGQGVEQGKTSKRRAAGIKAKSFKITAHAAVTVKLKLTPAMRQLLGRARKLTLRLTAKVKDPTGQSRTVSRTVTPKLKPEHGR